MSHYTDLARKIEKSILDSVGLIQNSECIKKIMKLDEDKGYVSKEYKAIIDSPLCRREFWISWIGTHSSGKTTIINSSLEYPLLPVSPLVMTGSVTRIKYSNKPYIIIYDENKKFLKRFDEKIDKKLFADLEEFFILCGDKTTVGLGNVKYFKDINGQIVLDSKDEKHVILLISTLFTAYVNQSESDEVLSENCIKLLELREKLFRSHFSAEIAHAAISGKTFMLEIGWDAPILASGLCFVDLPGLNSTVSKNNENLHDIITNEALKNTDAVVVTFEGKDFDSDTKSALEKWLNSAKIKASVSKDSRIVGLINKIDTLGDIDEDLYAITQKINSVFRSYEINNVSMFGVSALFASEARFYNEGIIQKHNFSGLVQKEIKFIEPEKAVKHLMDESRYNAFEEFLYDYAVKCKVIASSELVCLINGFIHKVFNFATDLVYSRHVVLTNSGIAYDEIITFLKYLNTDISNVFTRNVTQLIKYKNIEIISAFESKWYNSKSGFYNVLVEEIDTSLEKFMQNVWTLPSGATMLDKRLYLHKFDNETKLNSYFSVLRDYGISKFSKQISDFLVELINLVKGEYNELDLAVGDLYRDFNKNVESQYADLWNNEPDFALYKVMMKERGLPIDTYDTYLEFMRTLKAYNENPNNVDKQSPYYNVMRFCGELKDKLFEILSIGNNIDEILLQISKVDEVCEKMADEALTVMSAVYKAFSGKVQDIKSACMKEFMLTGNEYVNRTALQEMIDLIDRKTEAQNILDNIKGSIDTNFFGYASSSEGDRIETARKPAYNMCTRGDNLLNGVYSSAGYSKAELIINIKSALKIVNSLNETNDNIQENNIEEFKSYLGILAEQHNPPLQWSLSLKQEADNMNWCYISGETEAMLESVETEIQDAMRL